MEIIKEYLFHPNVVVRVIKGDVTKISADVCICGRARKLLQELRKEHEFDFKKFWEPLTKNIKISDVSKELIGKPFYMALNGEYDNVINGHIAGIKIFKYLVFFVSLISLFFLNHIYLKK